MHKINRICVFCGSSKGLKKEYTEATRELAKTLCAENIGLVYGGANVGLMKELADSMLEFGGDVIGVIPKFLVDREIAHEDISELHVVDYMYERNALMGKLADAFILLPGSVGSFAEFFEVATSLKLGLQKKPCGILNINNYYNDMVKFLDHVVNEQFLSQHHRNLMLVENTPQKLVRALSTHRVPTDPWKLELIAEPA